MTACRSTRPPAEEQRKALRSPMPPPSELLSSSRQLDAKELIRGRAQGAQGAQDAASAPVGRTQQADDCLQIDQAYVGWLVGSGGRAIKEIDRRRLDEIGY